MCTLILIPDDVYTQGLPRTHARMNKVFNQSVSNLFILKHLAKILYIKNEET